MKKIMIAFLLAILLSSVVFAAESIPPTTAATTATTTQRSVVKKETKTAVAASTPSTATRVESAELAQLRSENRGLRHDVDAIKSQINGKGGLKSLKAQIDGQETKVKNAITAVGEETDKKIADFSTAQNKKFAADSLKIKKIADEANATAERAEAKAKEVETSLGSFKTVSIAAFVILSGLLLVFVIRSFMGPKRVFTE